MRHDNEPSTEITTDTEKRTKTEEHGGMILALGCAGLLLLTIILNVSC